MICWTCNGTYKFASGMHSVCTTKLYCAVCLTCRVPRRCKFSLMAMRRSCPNGHHGFHGHHGCTMLYRKDQTNGRCKMGNAEPNLRYNKASWCPSVIWSLILAWEIPALIPYSASKGGNSHHCTQSFPAWTRSMVDCSSFTNLLHPSHCNRQIKSIQIQVGTSRNHPKPSDLLYSAF